MDVITTDYKSTSGNGLVPSDTPNDEAWMNAFLVNDRDFVTEFFKHLNPLQELPKAANRAVRQTQIAFAAFGSSYRRALAKSPSPTAH